VNRYDVVNASYALVILAFAVAIWRASRTRRVRRADGERARVIAVGDIRGSFAPVVHDVGPDNLRLLEDLDAHLDQHFARVAALYERVGPPGPDLAGLDRLRQAVHGDQNTKGDQL